MADNNVGKGLAVLTFIGLFFAKTCRTMSHESNKLIHPIEEELTHIKPKPDESFSCTRSHPPKDLVPILTPVDEDIKKVVNDDHEKIFKENSKRSESYHENSDGSFSYNSTIYKSFDEIPFSVSDNLYLKDPLTDKQAKHLMEQGVKFVYNNPSYINQKNSSFKIIYLYSDDIPTLMNLYEIDESKAKSLTNYFGNSFNNDKIIKVPSVGAMIEKQNEILAENQIPILIFHNSEKQIDADIFNPKSNFITCNSFNINPESYFTSTDFLDMRAIIEAVNSSYQNPTLEKFYLDFTSSYYSYMSEKNKLTTLVYLGSGLVVTSGVCAIAYYKPKNIKT